VRGGEGCLREEHAEREEERRRCQCRERGGGTFRSGMAWIPLERAAAVESRRSGGGKGR